MPNPETYYWDDWVLLAIQGLTLIALAVYVWKTWHIATATRDAAEAAATTAREANEARLAALAPRIMVYFSHAEIFMANIVLENAGSGTARDVRIMFDPPLQSSYQGESPNRFFETPKSVMPPGFRVEHNFDSWPSYLNSNLPRSYVVRVTYTGAENERTYDHTHLLDVSGFEHRVEIHRKDMDDLVREVERMRKDVTSKAEKIHQLMTLTYQQRIFDSVIDSSQHAVAELTARWTVLDTLDKDERVFIPWDAVLPGIRRLAIGAAEAAIREKRGEELRTALLDLARALSAHHGPGDAAWVGRVDAAMRGAATAIDAAYNIMEVVDAGAAAPHSNAQLDDAPQQIEKNGRVG